MAVDTPVPSPFCHEILNANPYAFLDDAPLEERRARAVEMRRSLPPELAGEMGALDPGAIEEVAEEAWPVVRDPDELHDALLTLVWVPVEEASAWNVHAEHSPGDQPTGSGAFKGCRDRMDGERAWCTHARALSRRAHHAGSLPQ